MFRRSSCVCNILPFFLQIDQDPTDVWGVLPKVGTWDNPNATLHGVTNGVYTMQYDLAYGPIWFWTGGRSHWFDFTPTVILQKSRLAYNFRETAVDFTLLLRPFALSAWLLVLASLSLTLLTVAFTKKWSPRIESDSLKAVMASGWAFFLLLNTFYGGALTMFLTSSTYVPFRTLEEGAKLHPTWKYLHLKETDLRLLNYLRSDGGIGLPKLLDRVLSEPDRYVVGSIEETLLRLSKEPGAYTLTQEFGTLAALNQGRYEGLDLVLFGETTYLRYHYLLAKNSPYRPLLTEGTRSLIETGTLETILLRWRGHLPKGEQDGMKVLGGRHLALLFVAYLAVYACCPLLLLLECLVKRLDVAAIALD